MVRTSWEQWLRGLGAGALGTLALTGLEPLRNAWLGHTPPYAVRHIATQGAKRWLGLRLAPRAARRWGLVTRWVYGPMLGALHAWLRPWLPQTGWMRGAVLGGGVWLFERLVFPRLGVTPPLRAWSPAERHWLAVQTLLFGLVTETATLTPPLSRREREGATVAPTVFSSPP